MAATETFTLINSIVVSGTSTSQVAFSSIPNTYKHLFLTMSNVDLTTSYTEALSFNSTSTTVYLHSWEYLRPEASSGYTSGQYRWDPAKGTSFPQGGSSYGSIFTMWIKNYNDTAKNNFNGQVYMANLSSSYLVSNIGAYTNSGPVHTIYWKTFGSLPGYYLAPGMRLSLYGVL